MATLFAQSIAQFAPLRTFARIPHAYAQYSQLIRELFPKALFDEQRVSYNVFIEIAWSFLSAATVEFDEKKWRIDQWRWHRIGGLPAFTDVDGVKGWYKDGKRHRDDKDPQTGLTLPAIIYKSGIQEWYQDGKHHRDDKDPRTGLTLPATIIHAGGPRSWFKNDLYHRDDKDPNTGLTLPAIIWADGSRQWLKNGKRHRDDRDPRTGSILPAVILTGGVQEWIVNNVSILSRTQPI